MLFTHFGISGPLVLTASSLITDIMAEHEITAVIDLKPALTKEQLDKRLLRDFAENINKNFKNSLDGLLPKKIIPVIIRRSGIPEDKKVNEITKEERQQLIEQIKELRLKISSTGDLMKQLLQKVELTFDRYPRKLWNRNEHRDCTLQGKSWIWMRLREDIICRLPGPRDISQDILFIKKLLSFSLADYVKAEKIIDLRKEEIICIISQLTDLPVQEKAQSQKLWLRKKDLFTLIRELCIVPWHLPVTERVFRQRIRRM